VSTGAALELVLAVAVACTLVAAIRRLTRREIEVFRCPVCRRPTSRAYPQCRHCGAPVG
jgi:hypothetical protein